MHVSGRNMMLLQYSFMWNQWLAQARLYLLETVLQSYVEATFLYAQCLDLRIVLEQLGTKASSKNPSIVLALGLNPIAM